METENSVQNQVTDSSQNQNTDIPKPSIEINQNIESSEKLPKRTLPWKIILPIVIIIAAFIGYILFPQEIASILQGEKPVEPVDPVVVVLPDPINPIKTIESSEYKISFEYNSDKHNFDQRSAFSTQPAYFLISNKQNRPETLENEKELLEGYLVKISVFRDIERNVVDLAERKIEKFKLECPTQKEIGRIYTGKIDQLETASFEVKNCDQEYVMSLAFFEGFVFEIAQIYRGDIGFKQQYKAQTDEIVKTIKWLRKFQEKPPFTTLKNDSYLIELDHPWLNETCCDITKPSIDRMEKIAILADAGTEETPKEIEKITDKIGIFAVQKNNKTLELFVNEQKQSLIQEYKVVEGTNPTGLKESNVPMGNLEGVKLENYAWWGTVIFVDHADARSFIVFVIPNGISGNFMATIGFILENARFLGR